MESTVPTACFFVPKPTAKTKLCSW